MPAATPTRAPFGPPAPAPHLGARPPSRAELMALARASRWWDLVPLLAPAIDAAPPAPSAPSAPPAPAAPADLELRLTLATAYLRLGLPTPAAEALGPLAPADRVRPPVIALAAAIAALPPDAITPQERHRTLDANLRFLAARAGPELAAALTAHLPAWRLRDAGAQCFRTVAPGAPANVVRRRAGRWELFHDAAALAAHAVATLAPPGVPRPGADGTIAGALVEGADPPALLLAFAPLCRPTPSGFRPPLTLVQADPLALLDGLSLADIAAPLADVALRVFVGPAAGPALAAHVAALAERCTLPLVACSAHLAAPVRDGLAVGAAAILQRALTAQQFALRAGVDAARRAYAPLTKPAWAARWRAARPAGAPDPLRILVITTRYSTFVRHAAEDLADALQGAGCHARALMEPDDASLLAPLAYAREVAQWRPDLLILINNTRAILKDLIPPQLPVLCWVQDAVPALFAPGAGASPAGVDYVIGHMYRELFDVAKWPRERSLSTTLVASEAKFHPAPAPPDALARHACEVAYVGHQSDTPEALADRLEADARAATPPTAAAHPPPSSTHAAPGANIMPAVIRLLAPRAIAIGRGGLHAEMGASLRHLAHWALRTILGREPAPEAAAAVANGVCRPLADRAIRHQTLDWAAAICARRGWRLHLYGRGWDLHPTLAPFAQGPLPHDHLQLRSAYQAAAAHLHASANTIVHQRVMECALAGGLPLCRIRQDDLRALHRVARGLLIERAAPAAHRPGRRAAYAVADLPEAMAYVALCQRLGLPHGAEDDGLLEALATARCDPWRFWNGHAPHPLEHALMGDLAELGFWSPASLERALLKAVTRPAWRADASAGIARRVRACLTYRTLAARILDLVSADLARAELDHAPATASP